MESILIELGNKILLLLFFMSCLTTLRHVYYFIQAFLTSTEEDSVKYKISNKALLFLCMSVAYILSVIFTGLKL